MDEEEAILQIELLNHDFFVFKNIDEEEFVDKKSFDEVMKKWDDELMLKMSEDEKAYYAAKAPEKAEALLRKMADQLFVSLEFFSEFGSYSSHELEKVCSSLEFTMQVAADGGSKELAEEILDRFEKIVKG